MGRLIQKILSNDFTQNDASEWISPDLAGDQRRTLRSGGKYVFNGTDNYIDIGQKAASATRWEVRAKFNSIASKQLSGDDDPTNDANFYWGVSSTGKWECGYGDTETIGTVDADTDWHDFVLDAGVLTVDGVEVADASAGTFVDPLINLYLGAADGPGVNVADYCDMDVAWMKYYQDGTTLSEEYHCDEGAGTTAYDVSGNENHGTISGTLTSFHDTDITLRSWRNEVGFTAAIKVQDDIRVGSGWTPPDSALGVPSKIRFHARFTRTDQRQLMGNSSSAGGFFGISSAGKWEHSGDDSTVDADTEWHNFTIESEDGSTRARMLVDGVTVVDWTAGNSLGDTDEFTWFGFSDTSSVGCDIEFTTFSIEEDGVLISEGYVNDDGDLYDSFNDTVLTYTEGSGNVLAIPRLETSANQALALTLQEDVLGNALTHYGRAKYDGILKSNVVQTNGTDVKGRADQTSLGASDYYYKWVGSVPTVSGTNRNIFGDGYPERAALYFHNSDGALRYLVYDGSTVVQQNLVTWGASGQLVPGDWMEFEVSRVGTGTDNVSWTVRNKTRGTEYTGTITESLDYSGTSQLRLNEFDSNNHSDSQFAYFAAGTSSSNLVLDYVFSEGDGATTYDRIGTNHLTWSGSLTNLRTQSEYQEPYNNKEGFDRWTNDSTSANLFVPLQSDGTSVKGTGDTITGYTWQEKVSTGSDKYHNGSDMSIYQPADCPQLYDIDQNDFTTAIWYNASGVPQAISFEDLEADYEDEGQWLIIKSEDAAANWRVYDTKVINDTLLRRTQAFATGRV